MASLAQRIIEEHAVEKPRDGLGPGDIAVVEPDAVLVNDVTGLLALRVLEETGADRLVGCRRQRPRIVIAFDHYSPAPTAATATGHRRLRLFARERGCTLWDVGYGVMHQAAVEELVEPGWLVLGADSHTITYGAISVFSTGIGSTEAAYAMATGRLWLRVPEPLYVRLEGRLPEGVTGKDLVLRLLGVLGGDGAIYRSVEFHGPGVAALPVSDRLTVANMMVEAGAKTALFPFDETAAEWYRATRGREPPREAKRLQVEPEPGADSLELDLGETGPMVAKPPAPYNVAPVEEVEGLEVDQVFIGSCTNGRYEDYVAAARILKGRRVKDGVRCIAVPASRKVYERLLRNGIIDILVEAGCFVAFGTCGPCIGAHLGLLGEGEVAVSTTNRNFTGRMGHKESKVYLASPATAAAAAVTGRITDPRELLPADARLMVVDPSYSFRP